MKRYMAIFREPDGRREQHSPADIKQHQSNWKMWLEPWRRSGRVLDGSGFSINGLLLHDKDKIENRIHQSGSEIIGGFLLFKADDLHEAAEMMKTCPLYEFGGYAEIRELQNPVGIEPIHIHKN